MSNIVSGLPGALVSLLAQSKNAEKKADKSGPETASPPPPPAPVTGEKAVRFDFSDPGAKAAAPVVASPAAGYGAPVSPTPASISISGLGKTGAPAESQDARVGSRTEPLAEADPDDEAGARAWAIQSIARENTLGMINRIARLAEQPEKSDAVAADAAADPRFNQKAVEPKTLAVA